MSIKSIYNGVRCGFQYKNAFECGYQAYVDGNSLPIILREFAKQTEGELDDQWENQSREILTKAINLLNTLVSHIYKIVSVLPVWIDTAKEWIIYGVSLVVITKTKLDAIAIRMIDVTEKLSLVEKKVRAFDPAQKLARLGVALLKVKNRLEKLLD